MHLFYDHGQAQVTMSLEELTDALKGARQNTAPILATATVNGARATRTRKKVRAVAPRPTRRAAVGGRTGERIRKAARRMVSRRPLIAKPKRKVARRNWGPIIAKRNATMARKREELERQRQAEQPQAASQ